ncbi:hypothetical protein Q4555_16020 [Octadecabacter sp. 1_MG-2023]|uniref:hypothetical protein n=1 Tax=unclassified Octadecabacter TaxID=196158 RepID=UPI001C098F52|nr:MULTISPECIES: hypothetical protein [unclassified Octadecabacter]MBU2991658.1 hypothetical protein [Octadecabacter sp. B2R22]MDO6736184.1 hypothetical protein [Octadecabacter sp. 1_MG-2023]
MIIDLEREIKISENLEFFEQSLGGMVARHYFTEAVRCAVPQPALFLAGISCLLHGIEGTLSQAIYESTNSSKQSEDDQDKSKHRNLNNKALKFDSEKGFNLEVLAFPEEVGQMKKLVSKNEPVGIVEFRNEFSHGKAYRATETMGKIIISDRVLLAPIFKALLALSYEFVGELARFRGTSIELAVPTSPFEY